MNLDLNCVEMDCYDPIILTGKLRLREVLWFLLLQRGSAFMQSKRTCFSSDFNGGLPGQVGMQQE